MKLRHWQVGVGTLAMAAALAAFAAMGANGAPQPFAGKHVDNFMLEDQHGIGRELYYYKHNPAVVLLTTRDGDKPSAAAMAALNMMRAPYEKQGVMFFALDSSDRAEPIGMLKADGSLPVLNDDLQMVGRNLGATSTAEVFVIDMKTRAVAYHGPVSEAKKGGASVAAALDALIAGKAQQVVEAKVSGTAVAFPDRNKAAEFAKISYSTDVAPILAAKCVNCHTKDGVAPFAMNSYETVKGFAPMIREALRTNRMPPYQSDHHSADFKNDLNLSDAQKLTVVNWIEAGAKRGEGDDPLPKVATPAPQWTLGKPDVVLDLPAYDIPASGILPYQYFTLANPTKEDKFLSAVAYLPGANTAVHHIVAGWNPEGVTSKGQGWKTDTGGWGPGSDPTRYPTDTGNLVPAGGSYTFEMHYTPNGKPQTDHTKVGIYYAKEPPKNILRQLGMADFSIEIPAGDGLHHERAYVQFPADVMLYAVRPHAHSRAYATRLTLRMPDGKETILHNQPRYDFNWQREYIFKDWMPIPKGSILIADYIYDNSENNPSNPNPKEDVLFGEQTFNEMLFTYVHYRIVGEDREHPRDDVQAQITKSLAFSVLDDNIDGKIEPEELRGKRFEKLKASFDRFDLDHDGGLDQAEYFAAAGGRARPADVAATPASATAPVPAPAKATGGLR